MSPIECANALFLAFTQGDDESVRNLCGPDFSAVQNGGPPMDLTTMLAFSKAVQSVVSHFRYENRVCSATENGFVEEHDVCGTLPNGVDIKLSLCIVGDIVDGKIMRLREYFDTAATADIRTYLSAA